MTIKPINQTKLFGHEIFFNELVKLSEIKRLPNKILFSGKKGIGKSTIAYHFINYILSRDEEFSYDLNNFTINPLNRTFKTMLNGSNPNFILIDLNPEKKKIEINQIRELILNLNKSSFNKKPRFILIDNIEFLNVNSINALLKIIEEPNDNVNFILINNNKKILPTLLSRCINFKIYLSNDKFHEIINKLIKDNLTNVINKEFLNYYSSPGNIYNLINFANDNKYDLSDLNLKTFLKIIIKNKHYKKDSNINYLIFDLIELYIRKTNLLSSKINNDYDNFLKKISDTKIFSLDYETFFIDFEDKILNA